MSTEADPKVRGGGHPSAAGAPAARRSAEPDHRMTQEQMARIFDVTDRTLRNWAGRGMPVEDGPHGRPVYGSAAFTWATQYTLLVRRDGKGPSHLSMDRARELTVEMQALLNPEDFVLVPLDWDHPLRAFMLEKAVAGLRPPP